MVFFLTIFFVEPLFVPHLTSSIVGSLNVLLTEPSINSAKSTLPTKNSFCPVSTNHIGIMTKKITSFFTSTKSESDAALTPAVTKKREAPAVANDEGANFQEVKKPKVADKDKKKDSVDGNGNDNSPTSSTQMQPHEALFSLIEDEEWSTALRQYTSKSSSFKTLAEFVERERKTKTVYPAPEDVFSLFNYTPLSSVKVVIVGQDPYHQPGQGHGLSFSVRKNIQIPPSLRNIYKEAMSDVGITKPSHGYLKGWADQGVFMLNAVLTVRRGEADSHKNKGWEKFTDEVIRILDKNNSGIVFLLWGKKALVKCERINKSKHTIITSSHPSPLGATKTNEPFIGSKCFSRCNEALVAKGKEPIDWHITG